MALSSALPLSALGSPHTAVYERLGTLASDEPLARSAVCDALALCGGRHARTVARVADLSLSLIAQGRDGEAEPLLRGALATQRRAHGHASPEAAVAVGALAALRLRAGDARACADAERLARQAMAITGAVGCGDAAAALAPAATLCASLAQQGRWADAARVCADTLAAARAALGDAHADSLAAARALAAAYAALGRAGDAEGVLCAALDAARGAHGAAHPEALATSDALADLLVSQRGRAADALALLDDALRARTRGLGEGHPRTMHTRVRHEHATAVAARDGAALHVL